MPSVIGISGNAGAKGFDAVVCSTPDHTHAIVGVSALKVVVIYIAKNPWRTRLPKCGP